MIGYQVWSIWRVRLCVCRNVLYGIHGGGGMEGLSVHLADVETVDS